MPQDLRHAFPTQEKDEAVFVFARPYWFTFLPVIILFVISFAFSLGFEYLASTQVIGSLQTSGYIILGIGIFQLFSVTVFLVALLDFYFDILIVTDERTVDINQEQLFSRKIAQLNLEDIEDVNSVIQGFFPTLLSYGTVQIQTAGEQENFIIPAVRYPNEITGIILSLSEQAKDRIDEEKRIPETKVVAVLDNRPVTDLSLLPSLRAMVPDDLRLSKDRE
jgi:uncharacterized membrane protein YdbT with pleckstrin-like domain